MGGLVGALTGFLGVGGEFLIVPALVFTSGLTTRKAIGCSLAIIAVNSASGLAGQLRCVRIDWSLTRLFLIASLSGMAFGVFFVKHIPEAAFGGPLPLPSWSQVSPSDGKTHRR